MKAAVIQEFRKPLVIKDVSRPELGPGDILVRIVASGVCHSDLHIRNGDFPAKPNLPLIPGHEGVGIVEEVGPGVTRVKLGDRVGVPWLFRACGECEYCIGGWEALCRRAEYCGYMVDGGYADYIKADARYVGLIPEGLSFEQAAPITCAGVTTYKAVKMTEALAGQWCAVFGVGGLGHLAVQYAKAKGLNVVGVDIREEALDLAKKVGADVTVNSAQTDPVKFIRSEVGGVQAAVSVAVQASAFRQAFDALRRGGTLVVVGLPPGELPIPILDMVLKATTVRGSFVGTRNDLREAYAQAAAGKVKAQVELQPLEAVNEVFQRMEEGRINGRVVLQP